MKIIVNGSISIMAAGAAIALAFGVVAGAASGAVPPHEPRAVPTPSSTPPAAAAVAPKAPAPEAPPDAGAPPAESAEFIRLNFPQTVELQVLVEYVSKRLGINIVYDESLAKTRVSISAPASIHKDALLGLLKSILDMVNLEVLDTGQPGWKTIGRKPIVRFVKVQHVSASDLAKQVGAMLEERDRVAASGPAAMPRAVGMPAARVAVPGVARAAGATLVPDPRTRQIAVIATESAAAEAVKLIEALDVAANVVTRSYRFRHVAPQRIDTLIKGRVANTEPPATYASVIDETSGLLVATCPEIVHEQIQELVKELDVEADSSRSFVRFYRLLNTTADDVLATIRSLRTGEAPERAPVKKPSSSTMPEHFTGPNLPPEPGTGELAAPPAYRPTGSVKMPGMTTPPPPSTAAHPSGSAPSQLAGTAGETGAPPSPMAALAQNAVVTADQNTNTIIVIAPPEIQKLYEQLINTLDKRRPQVLVEVTLVAIDTSDSFSLGVELSGAQLGGEHKWLVFSSFGLSTMDLATGMPTLAPGTGFNGIVVGSDTFSAVVQALAANRRAKVMAAPKVLVNDNATALLASISEAPFTSVNASQTVSTTSFAGYASAGTTVTVTPHISEGDHLQLKYSVTLNSFTDKAAGGIPPPRQTDTINSDITIPNGAAVIVGGLKRKDVSQTVSKVPWLGDIPALGYLFGLHSDTNKETTLFVFIRPLILRDDKFEDLKYLSDRDLELAQLPPNAPKSDPLLMP